jgi:DUF4097 and DUF4098 domain-containing protein YvlB
MKLTIAQRKMLSLGLIPVLALVLGGGLVTVTKLAGRLDYDFAAAYAVPADGVRITSDVPLDVIPSNDTKLHVSLTGSYTDNPPALTSTAAGGVLELVATCRPQVQCKVNLTVQVPPAAAVKLKVTKVSANVIGMSGDLRIDADRGSVNAARLTSPTVSVDARFGSVDLQFDGPPRSVQATSSDGSLQVHLPGTATYAIDAIAARGSTQLSIPNDLNSGHRIYLRSSYGSITVN